MSDIIILIIFLTLPIIMSLSAVTDIYGYVIPNIFSLFLIIGFYIFALINPNFTWEIIASHTLAALLILAITFALFVFGIIGGGDAKIIPASVLWIGWYDINNYVFNIILIGGILSIILLIWRHTKPFEIYSKFTPLDNLFHGPISQRDQKIRKRSVPYAIAITLGFYITLPESKIFTENFALIT